MAQHSNEHLTIAQLSAYVDKELAADELALCDAHLRACQLCQGALADLRLTSALLRGMPREQAPRSFVLPINIAVLPETPAHEERQSLRPRSSHYIVRRTLRALSTLAAVVGLVFFLAGALSALPHGGGMAVNSSATSSGASIAPQTATREPVSRATKTAPSLQDTRPAVNARTPTPAPTPTPSGSQATHQAADNQTTEPPPAVLDLGRPEGRLSIGSALFLLGLLGVVLARRPRNNG